MLVLTRKIGETIIIGENIRVTIVDIGQGRAKIGVVAPPHIKVDREEVREKKLHEVDPEAAVPVQMHNRISEQLASDLTPQPTAKPTLPFHKKPR
jgi:carbon storage regulator